MAAVDCFTGFVVAQSVSAKAADVSVKFLVDYLILHFGIPSDVQTENGTHFLGHLKWHASV